SGDQSTLNIFMVDYESYGFEHEEATWYSYEPYTDEDYASDLEEIARLKEEFSAFDRSTLSFYQQDTYDKISGEINDLDFLITNKDLLLMRQTYVDQFGGYAADLPTTLEAYNIRRVEDIEDIISYVASVEDAFATYDDYCLARAEAGYGFTNFTIAGMVKYLDGVSGRIEIKDEETGEVTNAGPYYLIALLENKIKASQETLKLTDDQINAYIEQLDAAFVKFINAHKTLAEDLLAKCLNLSLKDKDYYLTSYGEDGKKLYEYLLRSRIGIDMEIEDYISFLDTVIKKYFVLYSDYKAVGNSAAIQDGEVQILDSNEPDDIVEWLKEFAKTIVPDLASTPEIDIAYMDKTVTANTTTLAYYMKSPLDSFSNEYIHLNGDALGDDYLETVKTLGHEGYPGHLYAYVYSKENPNISNLIRVSTCTGHGEGWAKYVETAICDYIAKTKNKADWTVAMMQSKYWDLFVYAIYARVDVGLGYEEWGVDDVVKFFKNCNLVMDEDGAKELMQDLCEMPSTYAAYGYGQAYFYEIHTEAKTILGEDYNEVEFNDMLLSHGWLDLYKLEDLYAQYMSNKCFLLGIDYE
ncbi:MAG: DUF885 domain-containing protein, partial [Gammaproteobacteria bacterium]|nr:DUF885 domain-containing protein [Gammaproteobacteria bacterium]